MEHKNPPLRILVTGASGFVGRHLVPFLESQGHVILPLSHRELKNDSFSNPNSFENLDAVVHLAGANIAEKKWTQERKKILRKSRIDFTRSLCQALVSLKHPPKTMVTASGIGIFGNRKNDETLTEESKPGTDFLAHLAHDWEQASQPAKDAGIRVVHLRFGAILSSDGGMLQKLLPLYRAGLGGPLGSGKQLMPWIALKDVLNLVLFALTHEPVIGPVNAVAPDIVTNETFSKTLAHVLHKPNALRVPAFAVKLLLGEMGESLSLYSQRATNKKITNLGYKFLYGTLKEALEDCLETDKKKR